MLSPISLVPRTCGITIAGSVFVVRTTGLLCRQLRLELQLFDFACVVLKRNFSGLTCSLLICHCLRVIAGIFSQLSTLEFVAALHSRIQKCAIMRDDQESCIVRVDPMLEPVNALKVEVICGFVEQVEVARFDQQSCQQGATFLPARKLYAGTFAIQSQTGKNRFGSSFKIISADGAKRFLGVGVTLEVFVAWLLKHFLSLLEVVFRLSVRDRHDLFEQ